jgi:hypothetical protein
MFCLYTKTQNQKTDTRKQKTEDISYKNLHTHPAWCKK